MSVAWKLLRNVNLKFSRGKLVWRCLSCCFVVFLTSSHTCRSCRNTTPIDLDPSPCPRLGQMKELSAHESAKRQYSRFEVVKAPDVLASGSVDTEFQRSHNLQQLQLMTLLPSSEPQTPVSIQSTDTDEVRPELLISTYQRPKVIGFQL